ncbi:MAG TPA: BlaI/MecI/CopY family transcriptional regulator, partial [Tepidisphaeraceae bacterium]
WDAPQQQSSIRQLAAQVYPAGGASEFATVQKLLERLTVKGFVRRERDASPLRFSPAVTRDQLVERKLRSVAEKLCGGSLTPLLTHLVRSESLGQREREELRKLIDQLDRRRARKD